MKMFTILHLKSTNFSLDFHNNGDSLFCSILLYIKEAINNHYFYIPERNLRNPTLCSG